MCTSIVARTRFDGSAKGPDGWFKVRQLYVGYDHPVHADDEHAVLVDLIDEDRAGARVAFELSRSAARDLAERLLAVVDVAEEYETAPARDTPLRVPRRQVARGPETFWRD